MRNVLAMCCLLLGIICPAMVIANSSSTYIRFPLSISSTIDKPSFFYCDITPDPEHPTSRKFSADAVRVIMVNYGQMIRKFNNLGILDTNVSDINYYAFAAYHDPKLIYKNQNGFVDVFILWPAYQVTCKVGTGGRPLIPLYG